MTDLLSPLVLEDALRAALCRRYRRAYAHEMRNGLQGIYGGVDALTRAASKPATVPLERLTQFVQQAITNHERGLERVLETIAPAETSAVSIGVNELVTELVRFVTNDAARNCVLIKVELANELTVSTVPGRLRLILLGLLSDALDSQPDGGQIQIAGAQNGDRLQLTIKDARSEDRPDPFLAGAISQLIAQAGGTLDRQFATSVGCTARLEL